MGCSETARNRYSNEQARRSRAPSLQTRFWSAIAAGVPVQPHWLGIDIDHLGENCTRFAARGFGPGCCAADGIGRLIFELFVIKISSTNRSALLLSCASAAILFLTISWPTKPITINWPSNIADRNEAKLDAALQDVAAAALAN